jgi:hypothetical protein
LISNAFQLSFEDKPQVNNKNPVTMDATYGISFKTTFFISKNYKAIQCAALCLMRGTQAMFADGARGAVATARLVTEANVPVKPDRLSACYLLFLAPSFSCM